ncbi:MAG: hypothetical protein O7C98_09630 [Planctomycetota bacterium]|nr:hypothetical protein [Planctomycetota bacterium]
MATTFVLRHGMQTEPDMSARAQYIRDHATVWYLGWAVWVASALSLLVFYVWWRRRIGRTRLSDAAVLAAILGVLCDHTGEGLFMKLAGESESFELYQDLGTALTGGAANGMYTLGGIFLTLATRDLPRGIRLMQWVTWIAGVAMTGSAIVESVAGLVISGAILFPTFIVWVTWMGLKWRRDA